MFWTATANYGLDSIVLLAYAAHGTISWQSLGWYVVLAGIATAVFYVWIASGQNLTQADPSLTAQQMFVCGCIQLTSLALSPQLLVFFLSNLFVMAVFGTMQFGQRGFFIAWLLSVMGVAVVVGTSANLQIANSDTFERGMLVFAFAIVLARFAAITTQVSGLRLRLHKQNTELEAALKQVAELAVTDPLTGIPNRRELMRLIDDACQLAQRQREPLCIAMLDIDHFKKVNDAFGHAIGDEVLKTFANVVRQTKRDIDRLGRYGGEEFTLTLGESNIEHALVALNRLRMAVEANEWSSLAEDLKVTVSIGVAQWQPGEPPSATLERADAALYKAKAAGRNQVAFQE
jgi:diguanylate cyclase